MHIKILLQHGKNKRGSVNCSTKSLAAQLPPQRQSTYLFKTPAPSLRNKQGLYLTPGDVCTLHIEFNRSCSMHLTHEFGPMCCYLIGHLNSGISLKKTNKQNNPHQTPKPTNPKTQTQHKKKPTKNNTKQTKKNPTQNKAPTKKPQTLITTKF